jgi:cytosine/adenosine deaminase-related metal-dependent hydrolase
MDRDRVMPNLNVVVRDGRITSIFAGPAGRPPANAVVINGSGKYLMPGLAEMHGHIPPPNQPQQWIEDVLFMYVANGVTTVRGMLGAEGQLALREKAATGAIISPTLYLAGPSFNANAPKSEAEAVQMVRAQKAAGWDLLKVHPGPTIPIYDAMARTAKEVGIRFGGHVPAGVGLLHAIQAGQETFDHIDGYIEYVNGAAGPIDTAKLNEVVRLTKQAGAWIVPTMALWETLQGTLDLQTVTSYPELKYMPANQRQTWTEQHRARLANPNFNADAGKRVIQNRMIILKALHQGGVPILLGTDAPQQFSVPGFSIHREMKRMIDAGMSPYEVIKSGTQNVGTYFKSRDTFGTIAVGSRADFILVDANPLENVANIARRSGVMVRGKWIPETDIQARLAKISGF